MKTFLAAAALLAFAACGLPNDAQGNDVDHDSSACNASSEPAACPGGGSPQCESGKWVCCDPALGCNAGTTTTTTASTGGTGSSGSCDPSQQPAACPGGGAAQCESGSWVCCDPALGCNAGTTTTTTGSTGGTGSSGTCDPSQQPAACPGGGAAQCESGSWVCCDPALGCNAGTTTGGSTGSTGGSTGSSGTCDPSQQPAACPGGGAAQCESGSWVCCDPALGCNAGTTTGGSTGGSTGSTGGSTGGTGNTCGQASDCTGILPQTCEVCADGNQDCDHWDCVSSACQISICENDGGPGSGN